jgi:hypothetical protein
MLNHALASDFSDDNFERRLKITEEVIAEEKEKARREAVTKTKATLPFSEPLAIEICERVSRRTPDQYVRR